MMDFMAITTKAATAKSTTTTTRHVFNVRIAYGQFGSFTEYYFEKVIGKDLYGAHSRHLL